MVSSVDGCSFPRTRRRVARISVNRVSDSCHRPCRKYSCAMLVIVFSVLGCSAPSTCLRPARAAAKERLGIREPAQL